MFPLWFFRLFSFLRQFVLGLFDSNSAETRFANVVMLSNKLIKWTRNVVVALFSVLLLRVAYMRYNYDQFYMSSGDRALARMNLSM